MGLISASFMSHGKDDTLIHTCTLKSSQRELHKRGTNIFHKDGFQTVLNNSLLFCNLSIYLVNISEEVMLK